MDDIPLRHADTREALHACFPLMRQLRPHLANANDFMQRVDRMARQNYRVLAAWQGAEPLALAGYRVDENLIYGRFLYVDDLVTAEVRRGANLGARLLAELTDTARREDCARLVLDTGLANALAQRFYFRQGLLTSAMRFSKPLEP